MHNYTTLTRQNMAYRQHDKKVRARRLAAITLLVLSIAVIKIYTNISFAHAIAQHTQEQQ